MKKFLVVMSYLALASSLWAADFSLNPARDFGAIRRINPTDYDGKNVVREDGTGLSSDTAEAFRNALEVFSKAYVQSNFTASSTLSAHAIDNSDVHGCTAIASASAVADALSAANASDALNVRLDGSRAMTGNLKFSGNYGILQSTSDGADSGEVTFGGGGSFSVSRGAYLRLLGNESASTGQAQYYAGNVSGGDHIFYTAAGTERMRITYGGNVGFGSTSPGRNLVVKDVDGSVDMSLQAGNNTGYSTLYFGDSDSETAGYIQWNHTKNSMALGGGNVLIGTTTDDGVNKLQVNGSMALSSFATLASPTVVPPGVEGRVYYNGTEKKLKFYNGSAWVDL